MPYDRCELRELRDDVYRQGLAGRAKGPAAAAAKPSPERAAGLLIPAVRRLRPETAAAPEQAELSLAGESE
jgi:hypothetical protein